MQQTAGNFRARALMALALLVGFYVLAIGLVIVLGLLLYLTLSEGRVGGLTITAVIAIVAILRGVFFVDKSDPEPVGILIDERSQPRLQGLVDDVARAVDAEPPDRVYLVPDVNAFVYEDGKFMGLLRTKRIMGIGLGLLNVLHVDEVKAVLAHEYGHFAGGDTRLSGIVYRTRAAIGRTITHLKDSWLTHLFDWYGRLFLRLTQRMSRQQELDADALAARVGGRHAQSEALEKINKTAPAFDWLIDDYVGPLWHAKRRPANLYSGFRNLLNEPTRKEQLAQMAESMRNFEDAYDSHPSLERRIAHITQLPAGPPPEPAPARDLLADPEKVEQQMTEVVSTRALEGRSAPAADWDEVVPAVVDVLKQRAQALREVVSQRGAQGLTGVLGFVSNQGPREAGRSLIRLDRYPAEMQDVVARSTLTETIFTLAADELLSTPGFEPKLSWAGPLDIQAPDGTVVPLYGWAEQVAGGSDTPDAFTARLQQLRTGASG